MVLDKDGSSIEFFERRVDFIHRTARDFIQTKDIHDMLKFRVGNKFNPREFLCKALLVQIKSLPSYHEALGISMRNFIYYAYEIETIDGWSVEALLDEFDRVVTVHGRVSNKSRMVVGEGRLYEHIRWDHPKVGSQEVTFLEYAVQSLLHLYVARKMENQPRSTIRKFASTTLPHVLPPNHDSYGSNYKKFERASLQIVYLLLEQGASPNDRVSGRDATAWLTFLTCMTFYRSAV